MFLFLYDVNKNVGSVILLSMWKIQDVVEEGCLVCMRADFKVRSVNKVNNTTTCSKITFLEVTMDFFISFN